MKKWYAVHCKSRKEDVVQAQLEAREIEVFYPKIKIRKNDQKSITTEPYFSGYLFICVDEKANDWSKIKWIPFTIGIVGYGGKPISIPEHFITRLRALLNKIDRDAECKDNSHSKLKDGDLLDITGGPLKGYEAVFISCKSGTERASILLQLIKDRFVQIELPIHQICLKKEK